MNAIIVVPRSAMNCALITPSKPLILDNIIITGIIFFI